MWRGQAMSIEKILKYGAVLDDGKDQVYINKYNLDNAEPVDCEMKGKLNEY